MPRRTIVSDETLKQVKSELKLFQEAIEFEKKKTAAQQVQLSQVKTKEKRLEYAKRRRILSLVGREAERRYQYNLVQTGYQGEVFKHAFKFEIDEENFQNYYYLDTGSVRLNLILQYLEYGTGLYGSLKSKWIESTRISPTTGKRLLLKFNYEGRFIFTRKVRGVKPGFMFSKAVDSIQKDMDKLVQYYRLKQSSGG